MTDFEMFSAAGNKLVSEMVAAARNADDLLRNADDLFEFLREQMELIAAAGHGEVYDSDVCRAIADAVEVSYDDLCKSVLP